VNESVAAFTSRINYLVNDEQCETWTILTAFAIVMFL